MRGPDWCSKRSRLLIGIFGASLLAILCAYNIHLYSLEVETAARKSRVVALNLTNCPRERLAISSTNGCSADRKGSKQKVIAYSLYGDFTNPDIFTRYIDPMKRAIEGIRREFPEWIIRIYNPMDDLNPESDCILRAFFHSYDNVDLCNVNAALEFLDLDIRQMFPMIWRFLPLVDPTVDYFMSRDTDGVFLDREVQAVKEWLASPATFHVMRDHPWHCISMLGGLWGAKIYQDREYISKGARKLLGYRVASRRQRKGLDQNLLAKYIWPLARNTSMMVHDSYCCSTMSLSPPDSWRPFPTRRVKAEYVGDVYVTSQLPSNQPRVCPSTCRPTDHPEWNFC